MNDKSCLAVKRDGQPCRSTIITADGYCQAHSPNYKESRRWATSKAGQSRGDRDLRDELREIRESLAGVRAAGALGQMDEGLADTLTKIDRARIYAARTDAVVRRHGSEVADLEDYATELECELDEIKNGRSLR